MSSSLFPSFNTSDMSGILSELFSYTNDNLINNEINEYTPLISPLKLDENIKYKEFTFSYCEKGRKVKKIIL